jgi:hypothetical protein
MKKIQRSSYFFILFLIVLSGCGNSNPYQSQQEALAKQLGVKIEDHSYPKAFPEGYFYEVLKPGMSPHEVHEIIKYYDVIYSCEDYKEIYYYFSKNDDQALRFQIFYDKEGKFEKLQGEDDNSKYIKVNDCILGTKIGE